jgi:hypothetical protein
MHRLSLALGWLHSESGRRVVGEALVVLFAARPEVFILYRRFALTRHCLHAGPCLRNPASREIDYPKGTGPVGSNDVRSALVTATGEFDTKRGAKINRRWRRVDGLRVLAL